MRALLVLVGIAAIVLVVLMSLGMVSIDQTRPASLPRVSVEGGQAPKFDAEVGRIDIGTTNKTVEVPTIDVQRADNAQQ